MTVYHRNCIDKRIGKRNKALNLTRCCRAGFLVVPVSLPGSTGQVSMVVGYKTMYSYANNLFFICSDKHGHDSIITTSRGSI